jgi:hypothetical protein
VSRCQSSNLNFVTSVRTYMYQINQTQMESWKILINLVNYIFDLLIQQLYAS